MLNVNVFQTKILEHFRFNFRGNDYLLHAVSVNKREWHSQPIAAPHVTMVRSYLIQEEHRINFAVIQHVFEIKFEKHIRGVFNWLLVQAHT